MPITERNMSASSESTKRSIKSPVKSTLKAMNNSGPAYHDNVYHEDAYYEEWYKKRDEAIARGEDPYARFLALVAARKEQSASTKLKRLFSKEKQYTRRTSMRLDPEEEEEARRRDAARIREGRNGARAAV
ncbi:hypothetical protein MMC06_004915 [Schaereria dolodes]|nr:hypothetical protein [Schaereria dolodes]